MNFMDIFSSSRKKQSLKEESPNHWIKCKSCHALMYDKELVAHFNVCPKCGYHLRLTPKRRVELLADSGTFVEYDQDIQAIDPLKFVDSKSYKKRLSESYEKTKKKSAVVSGECLINGMKAQLVVFDFSFMGGSMGSVEGEKIVRAAKRAMEQRSALVTVSASGGARMQESTFSLMQMAKTSAIVKMLEGEKIPYISVLSDPTMGGVSASFAWLGDLVVAEPGALIGFAGARVIKQTIGADLPEGFQRAEFLLEHGLIDGIVPRHELKNYISDFLKFFKL